MFEVEINFGPESQSVLFEIPERLMQVAAEALGEVAREYVLPAAVAGANALAFEGEMARDLRVSPLRVDALGASITIGESGDLLNPDDPWRGRGAFSYPLAKHEGASPHTVYLYDSRSGSFGGPGTKFRRKLRRFVRQKMGRNIPETRWEFDEMNDQLPRGARIAPFLRVNPSRRKSPFLVDAAQAALRRHFTQTMEDIWARRERSIGGGV